MTLSSALRSTVAVAIGCLPFLVFASEQENPSCREDSRVIAACFKVHGRLSNWNGNPTQRMWIVGTTRMLGLRVGPSLPKALEDKLGDFDDEVYGDFEFCPFTPQKSGVMQVGWVAGVSNYQIKKRER